MAYRGNLVLLHVSQQSSFTSDWKLEQIRYMSKNSHSKLCLLAGTYFPM